MDTPQWRRACTAWRMKQINKGDVHSRVSTCVYSFVFRLFWPKKPNKRLSRVHFDECYFPNSIVLDPFPPFFDPFREDFALRISFREALSDQIRTLNFRFSPNENENTGAQHRHGPRVRCRLPVATPLRRQETFNSNDPSCDAHADHKTIDKAG